MSHPQSTGSRSALALRQHVKGMVLLAASGLLWGLVPVLSKTVVSNEAHPVGLALLQNAIGAVLGFAYCHWRSVIRRPSRQALWFYVQWAILYSVVNQVFVYWLASRIEAAVISFVIILEGFAVFFAAAVLRLERPCWRRCMGLAIGLAGTMTLLFTREVLGSRGDFTMFLIALLVPFSYAAEDIYIAARRPTDVDPIFSVALVMACSVPMLAGLAYATDDFMPMTWPPGQPEMVTLALTLVALAAYLTFFKLISFAGPVFAGQVCYATTLSGIFWSVVLLGEQVSWGMVMSLACVMGGLLLVQPRPAQHKSKGSVEFISQEELA